MTQNAQSYTINPALRGAVGLLMRLRFSQGACVFIPELQGHVFPTALVSQCQSLIMKKALTAVVPCEAPTMFITTACSLLSQRPRSGQRADCSLRFTSADTEAQRLVQDLSKCQGQHCFPAEQVPDHLVPGSGPYTQLPSPRARPAPVTCVPPV